VVAVTRIVEEEKEDEEMVVLGQTLLSSG